jgi:predicted transcriptional regulator
VVSIPPSYPILGYETTASYIARVEKSTRSIKQSKLQGLLRQIRLEAGLRQVDMAERLGQPQSLVSKYESGERRLDLLELREVCKAAGISLEEFACRFEESLR